MSTLLIIIAWSIYSKGISGSFILSSDLYFRILMAMVFIGFATTIKRVAVAIRFGKRLLGKYAIEIAFQEYDMWLNAFLEFFDRNAVFVGSRIQA